MPGYKAWNTILQSTSMRGLLYVDHCVGNVRLEPDEYQWVSLYERSDGLPQYSLSFDDKDISTEYSALMSKVMSNGNGHVKFPINEPAEGERNRRWKSTWIL